MPTEREVLKRYPKGAMGGICWTLFGKKTCTCRLKSTRSNGNGDKTVTLVCKVPNHSRR